MSKEKLANIKDIFVMIVLVVFMFGLVGFTIYLDSPDDVEINQIMYAGRETIKNNNKLAFDLLMWAPGYTDQAIIQIDNNTIDELEYTIKIDVPKDTASELMEYVDVYIKKNPTSFDVLERYDSIITEGYTYVGSLEHLKNNNVKVGSITNEHVEYSILLHVNETADFDEIEHTFENILTVETNTLTKTFE